MTVKNDKITELKVFNFKLSFSILIFTFSICNDEGFFQA